MMYGYMLPSLSSVVVFGFLFSCLVATGLFRVAEGRPSGHVRVRRQLATTNNTVELLVVADQQAYSKYLTRNGNNDTAARNELLRYVAGLVREVNERFANLDAGGFSVRVSLADLVVLSLVESNATENNVVSGTVVNGDLGLQAFQLQANALAANFSHDYAVLLTGYNVTRGNGSDADVRTFFGAVCSARRQGIVENFCVERTALALTKGIALSLGGRIDALANSCPDDFYVMSFNFNLPPREASGNPFTFSNCTGPEIRNYLDFFAFTSCVRTDNVSNPSPIDLAPLTATELAQTYDADTQCQLRFGNGSRLCRDLYGISSNRTYVDDLCREMLCLIPGNNTCQGSLPFDGTSCGNQQWCQDGTCTSDPAAPTAVSDTCPQGDNPGSVCLKSLCGVGGSLYSNFICCATCASEVPAQNVTVSVVEGTVTVSVVDARTVSLSMPSSQKKSTLSLAGNASSAGTAAPTVSVVNPSSTQGPNSTLSVGTPTVPVNVSTTQKPVTLSLVGTTPSRNTTPSQQNVTLSLVGTTPSRNTTPSQRNVTLSLNNAMANRTETTTVPANTTTQSPATVSIIETGVTQTVSIVEPEKTLSIVTPKATTISVVAINTSALSLNTTTGPSVVGG